MRATICVVATGIWECSMDSCAAPMVKRCCTTCACSCLKQFASSWYNGGRCISFSTSHIFNKRAKRPRNLEEGSFGVMKADSSLLCPGLFAKASAIAAAKCSGVMLFVETSGNFCWTCGKSSAILRAAYVARLPASGTTYWRAVIATMGMRLSGSPSSGLPQ